MKLFILSILLFLGLVKGYDLINDTTIYNGTIYDSSSLSKRQAVLLLFFAPILSLFTCCFCFGTQCCFDCCISCCFSCC